MSKLHEIFCTLPVAVARSCFDDTAIRYAIVLWMTSCLPVIGEAKAMLVGHVLSDSLGGRTGGKAYHSLVLLLQTCTDLVTFIFVTFEYNCVYANTVAGMDFSLSYFMLLSCLSHKLCLSHVD